MKTSFASLGDLESYVVDNNTTIISGMHSIKGDLTGRMAEDLVHDGYEFAFAFGFYGGKYEPSLIIPNLSVGVAIRLALEYDQTCMIHDGLMFMFGDKTINMVKQLGTPQFFYSKEDPAQESLPFTEVIIESGRKARIRY